MKLFILSYDGYIDENIGYKFSTKILGIFSHKNISDYAYNFAKKANPNNLLLNEIIVINDEQYYMIHGVFQENFNSASGKFYDIYIENKIAKKVKYELNKKYPLHYFAIHEIEMDVDYYKLFCKEKVQ